MAEDRFAEKITPFIRQMAQSSDAFRQMYFFDPAHEDVPANRGVDLFFEKRLTRTKGLVYKYTGRALLLLSYTCAANCRYCERQDRVGVGLDSEGRLSSRDIRDAVDFLREHEEIYEVIFSGGDPLTHPKGLRLATHLLSTLAHVQMLRIHTRFPMQFPDKMDWDLMDEIAGCHPTFYLSLHIDHPDELTHKTVKVIRRLRSLGFILLCQSVFLKGVNDDVDVLKDLFRRLATLGVRPYYIYHCQPIPTTMRFTMSLQAEIEIMTELREQLSGLAFPQHVLELQHTTGKIIVPTRHWDVNTTNVRDFLGNVHNVCERALVVQTSPSSDEREKGILPFLQE